MLKLKGTESGYDEFVNITANGKTILDSQIASKAFTSFVIWNLGNSICSFFFSKKYCKDPVKEIPGMEAGILVKSESHFIIERIRVLTLHYSKNYRFAYLLFCCTKGSKLLKISYSTMSSWDKRLQTLNSAKSEKP